jgi:hypothetical protein
VASATVDQPTIIVVPTQLRLLVLGTNGATYATITVTGVTGGSGNYIRYDFVKTEQQLFKVDRKTVIPKPLMQEDRIPINAYDDNMCW